VQGALAAGAVQVTNCEFVRRMHERWWPSELALMTGKAP
jgi:hypothetical protein